MIDYKMDHLPNETITHILQFIPDKVYASMVSKRWRQLLDGTVKDVQFHRYRIDVEIYDGYDYYEHIIYIHKTYNDPFTLTKYVDAKNILKFKNNIQHVTNHNCLNYVWYVLKYVINLKHIINIRFAVNLLAQNCRVNNVSKPKYIFEMWDIILSVSAKYIMLDTILKHKSYDMLFLLAHQFNDLGPKWLEYHNKRNTLPDELIKEIDIFVDKNIMTYLHLYNLIYDSSVYFELDILPYLRTKIDKDNKK